MNKEKQLLDVITNIYQLPFMEESWDAALAGISQLFDGVCVSFEIVSNKKQNAEFLRLSGDFDMSLSEQYLPYYAGISPRVMSASDMKQGDVSYDYQLISESRINSSEFYNDFLKPQDMRYFIAGHFLSTPSHSGVLAVQRNAQAGHVQNQDIELMKALVPHLSQSLELKSRLNLSTSFQYGIQEHLQSLTEAVFLFNHKGELKFCNQVAEQYASEQDGISCSNSQLRMIDVAAYQHFLYALANIENVGETHDFVIKRPSQKRPYRAYVRAVSGGGVEYLPQHNIVGMLIVRDPEIYSELDTQQLSMSYSLTAQELELAVSLHQGFSLKKIASTRAVSITTVRTQLYSLMQKLSVNRQVDLIKLLSQYERPFLK